MRTILLIRGDDRERHIVAQHIHAHAIASLRRVEVRDAGTLAEALRLEARGEPMDLLILNLEAPDGDPIAFAAEKGAPVVLLSSQPMNPQLLERLPDARVLSKSAPGSRIWSVVLERMEQVAP